MKGFSRQIEADVYEWLDPAESVKRRNIKGGTGPEAVKREIDSAKGELGD